MGLLDHVECLIPQTAFQIAEKFIALAIMFDEEYSKFDEADLANPSIETASYIDRSKDIHHHRIVTPRALRKLKKILLKDSDYLHRWI